MQQHSKTRRFPTMRAIVVYLLTGIAIVSILVVDAGIRRSVGGELSIEGLPLEGASLTGRWHPDLFWFGKAWWIEIETEKPIRLSLDGKDYAIPAGAHELFSNHDHTNTGQYGDMEFWGYPVKVVVSSID